MNVTVRTMTLNADQIATALKIELAAVIKEFQDGRVASRFSEHWAARLFDFHKHNGSNVPHTDGERAISNMGSLGISVRTLTKRGVKFQQSKFIGSGRMCTMDNLVCSVEATDMVCVVDITEFPSIQFVLLDTKILLKWIRDGQLAKSGLGKVKFYTLVNEVEKT